MVRDAVQNRVKDTIIQVQQQKYAELEGLYERSQATTQRIIGNLEMQLDAERGKTAEATAIGEVWEKEAKKKQKGSRWLKAGIVAAFIGGLLLGR